MQLVCTLPVFKVKHLHIVQLGKKRYPTSYLVSNRNCGRISETVDAYQKQAWLVQSTRSLACFYAETCVIIHRDKHYKVDSTENIACKSE